MTRTASYAALLLLSFSAVASSAQGFVSGTNPRPQFVSGTNPRPSFVSGTNPRPSFVSGTNPRPQMSSSVPSFGIFFSVFMEFFGR